ncbi:MAG: NUDIX domain-containing protein [Bacteroidota bacterium]|nr:NUDIX domain-containing protein [Bacteroidota bacterium]
MQIFSETHPSNVFSYCPKCGSGKLLFDGVKVLSCNDCGFNFYINPAPAVAVILVYPDGKIVLTRRKHDPMKGTYDLPGGFVEINERIEDAVVRETFEELHVKVTGMNYLGSFPNEYVYKGISYFTCDLAFVCPVPDGTELHPSDDVSEAIKIKPKDIDYRQISFLSIRNILQLYISRLGD